MRFLWSLLVLCFALVVRSEKSSVAFVDPSKSFITNLPSQLSSIDLADVAGRVLGVGSLSNNKNLDFVSNDLFHRARANVHISVLGLEQEDATKQNLPFLKQVFSSSSSFSAGFSSADEVSIMTSVASGQLPSQHGVAARKWSKSGEEQVAFMTPGAGSLSLSVADQLAQLFDGQSLIVSASSDSQLVSSTCISEELSTLHPSWNNLCVSNSATRQEPAALVAAWLPAESSTLASFDLNNKETATFFAELALFDSLLTSLNSQELQAKVNDNIPDLFYFHFASLKALSEQYGSSSQQYAFALRLVDALVSRLVQQLQTLYKQQVLVEVLLLSPSVPATAADVSVAVERSVLNKMYLFTTAAATNTTGNPSSQQVQTYQIVLWLSISLAFVLLAAVWSLAFMHFKKDTMIFGHFNPNWEDRKRS